MDIKTRIRRSLARATCDKTELDGPCKMMAPAVEKLAEEYEGKAVIGKLDVEESMDIAGRYGVMNVPTLILFKDGRAVERKVGLQSASDLRKLLDSVL